MLIGHLIRKDFSTVNAFHGIHQLKKTIAAHGGALVVMEDSKAVGIISAHDLATMHHNLVIDCITSKPVLSRQHMIPEVLSIMKEVHSDLLMVYDGDEMLGVLHKNDITDYLCQTMEQQKTLVHSIAHDLKNPLASVLSIAYLLEESGHYLEEKELIGYAKEACNYANEIVNDLLFSEDQQKNPLRMELVDLNGLLIAAISSFHITAANKVVDLVVNIDPGKAMILADAIKLKRAFNNLLSNAVKFTPRGGTVTIEMKAQANDYLIKISDTGIGIPIELQPGIFEKFTRAQRKGTNGEQSTGLGMYITQQIIELHRGNIRMESKPGEGTSFYVKLRKHAV
ncbi:sensor histidine kinase [Mucilaginibacter polytrichastri]|uniref:histidine kinase n=1 Tax=Mucilaginibacter polytrichastri TaxID=1302689 RepID=A0A1Q5ZZT0_9SPHI|nr:HAMP domain-containing sensor histidine kinase [Mucilaginibacter polytrichastri]OKS87275.1 hypothetical protein RG47T_2734 [Mucilaginibacter polytrichastri]SFT18592.1 Signal transduction histidine kinase [Mucilaginibacter polytrichastri]